MNTLKSDIKKLVLSYKKYRLYAKILVDETIVVKTVKLPKQFQRKGLGTHFFKALFKIADKYKISIELTPADEDVNEVEKGFLKYEPLYNWYKKLGFKDNNRYGSWEHLIKYPKK